MIPDYLEPRRQSCHVLFSIVSILLVDLALEIVPQSRERVVQAVMLVENMFEHFELFELAVDSDWKSFWLQSRSRARLPA